MDNYFMWFALVIAILVGAGAVNDIHTRNVQTEQYRICMEAGGAYDGEANTCTITK